MPTVSAATAAYPPPLTDVESKRLVQCVKDWSICNGLAVRPPHVAQVDPADIAVINAPVTLFPSRFPRACFEEAVRLQQAYNRLYASVSCDEEFLTQIVEELSAGDDFIRNLWWIHLKVKNEGYVQPLALGLFRSDYMPHQEDHSTDLPTLQIKQVEFNTIASSFGGLSTQTSQLHKYMASTQYPLLGQAVPARALDLPENKSIQGLAAGIEAAFHAYSASDLGFPKCVIFLVQEGERNIFDQRHIEHQLSRASIPVFRLTFADILAGTHVADNPQRPLLYRLPANRRQIVNFEVAVVYLRAGYGPADYPDKDAWEARYRLERSAAIKCPTVLTQLAGTKKVQQVLAVPQSSPSAPSILRKFLHDDDEAEVNELQKTFTSIYPMDASAAGLEARRKALDAKECQAYVLKPQREGGGNNIYRGAIPDFLKTIPESHWASYILMELIEPPPMENLILRNGLLETGGVISELGIYGACLWNQQTGHMLYNEMAGYLLRTKGEASEEGGVAAGYGCMDSCALV